MRKIIRLAICLLVALSLVGAQLAEDAFAKPKPQGKPQAQQQSAERQIPADKPVVIMKKISEVIGLLRDLLSDANEGGKEYIIQYLGVERGGCDFCGTDDNPSISPFPTDVVNAYCNEVSAAAEECWAILYGPLTDPNDPNSRDGSQARLTQANGNLVVEIPGMFEVFRLEKMGESPFPFISLPNGQFGRDLAGKQAAADCAAALKKRNSRIIEATLTLLNDYEKFCREKLTAGGTQEELKQKIHLGVQLYLWFIHAHHFFNEVAAIKQANQRYIRDNEIYAAYMGYSEDSFKAFQHLNTFSWVTLNKPTLYTQYSRVNVYLIDWFSAIPQAGEATFFDLNCDATWSCRGSTNQPPQNFAATDLDIRRSASYNIGATGNSAEAALKESKILNSYCPKQDKDGDKQALLIKAIVGKHLDFFNKHNQRFNQQRKAMGDLVGKLNKIIGRYRDYFPYSQGYQLSPFVDYPPKRAYCRSTFALLPIEPVYKECALTVAGEVVVGSGTPTPVTMIGRISENTCASGVLRSGWGWLSVNDDDVNYYDPVHFHQEWLGPNQNHIQTSFLIPGEYGIVFNAVNKANAWDVKGTDFSTAMPGMYHLEDSPVEITGEEEP